MDKKIITYEDKFRQMDKEALYTLIAALFITIVFWACIFIFQDNTQKIFYMPMWFVFSCIGGYFLSILVVSILIKFFFKNFSFEDHDELQ